MNSTPEAGSADAANEAKIRDSVPLKSAEASFRRGWQESLAGQTRPVSKLWERVEPTPTVETQLALEEAQTRQNLASFADFEELYEDLGLEAAHLLRSPANAERLLTTLARAQAGTTEPQSLDELRREIGLDEGVWDVWAATD
jgi:signal transduction histidine kinase